MPDKRYHRRDDERKHDAEQPAQYRKENRLEQELQAYLYLFCAHSAAETYLLRTLKYRCEHDVHDADAAYEERYACDAPKDDVEYALCLPMLL